jgi:hypothetical protein
MQQAVVLLQNLLQHSFQGLVLRSNQLNHKKDAAPVLRQLPSATKGGSSDQLSIIVKWAKYVVSFLHVVGEKHQLQRFTLAAAGRRAARGLA